MGEHIYKQTEIYEVYLDFYLKLSASIFFTGYKIKLFVEKSEIYTE